ncbi:MAG: MgtC/SapB family protein [Gemmatimonadota bacterium]|nr:MAG: MgtC/SapB family protein [Gemmatimonadota bacterium]
MVEWLDPAWIDTLRLGLLGRILLATALGGLIGLEREISGKPAGLRTNILICVGATLLMDVSQSVAAAAVTGPADPGRIAAQVVSGIGFIGAGTILVERGSVVGLTTAATLWVVAAIGLAVGSHAYVAAIGTALLVALTLVILGWIEDALFERRTGRRLDVVVDPADQLLDEIAETLQQYGVRALPHKVEKQADRFRVSYELRGSARNRGAALSEVAAMEGVRKVTVH